MAELPPQMLNSYVVTRGENLPNHSTSLAGKGKFVGISTYPVQLRTAQEAYRLAAWLIVMAEGHLPNEDGAEEHTAEVVLAAVRGTKPR